MRIIITGDIRRPNSQTGNIEFLYHLVQYQIKLVTGIQCECISGHENILDVDSWAKLFNSHEHYSNHIIENSIVIGFEIPPVFIHQLERSNNKVINICLSPIRFMHDLNWNITTNYPCMLYQWLLSEDQIRFEASVISSATTRLNGPFCDSPSVLLVGQSPNDRSVILGDKFVSLRDYVPQIIEHIKDFKIVLLKPHPYHQVDFDLPISFEDIRTLNIYKILTEPRVTTIISLSSSVLTEAKYFNKNIIRLIGSDPTLPVSTDTLLNPLFWKTVLSPIIETLNPPTINTQASRDLTRKIVQSYWGMDFLK